MKERPIIFSGEMVRAMLEGRKTQTRRVIKPQPTDFIGKQSICIHPAKHQSEYFDAYNGGPYWCWWTTDNRQGPDWIKCPYGVPGDRLWLRETFSVVVDDELTGKGDCIYYRATSHPEDLKWKPSIYMPRWASRILLEITDVRVERVQDISDDDAKAEGVGLVRSGIYKNYWPELTEDNGTPVLGFIAPSASFYSLWDSINHKRRYGTDVNPWVWVIGFKRVET